MAYSTDFRLAKTSRCSSERYVVLCYSRRILRFRISQFSRTAEHQAKLLALLYESPLFQLTPKEEQILLRGRNSASSTRSRQNAAAYQDATSLEALIGYLYLSDRLRCEELMNWIYAHLDQVDE